ncbi:MAG: hypothetical protein PUF37_01040 [Prevotellaceae bacterium]|nr:hypothetical protein [Prevotellaceae bacterium]
MYNEEEYYNVRLKGRFIRVYKEGHDGDIILDKYQDVKIDFFFIDCEGDEQNERYVIMADGGLRIVPTDPYMDNINNLMQGDIVDATCLDRHVGIKFVEI